MPAKKMGWTTVSLPIWVRDKLAEYGGKRDTWEDVIMNLIEEVEDLRKMKERYKLK